MRTDIRSQDVVTTVALEDGALVSGTTQDCTPYAERAKALHNSGYTGSSEMKLAASVPFVMVEAYLNRNNLQMSDFIRSSDHQKRFLNDPSLAHFRMWKGRI